MDLGNLPGVVFSPAKMIYIGYVTLAALQRFEVSLCQFVVVSVAFLVVQVGHDDYLRIVLNRKALGK